MLLPPPLPPPLPPLNIALYSINQTLQINEELYFNDLDFSQTSPPPPPPPPPPIPYWIDIIVPPKMFKPMRKPKKLVVLRKGGQKGCSVGGNDVYTEAKRHAPNFFALTRMTVGEFENLHAQVRFDISACRIKNEFDENNEYRPCRVTKLNTKNRLLMTVMWLAGYCKYSWFQLLFGVSKSTISRDIHHVLPILYCYYKSFIRFPSPEEIDSKMQETRSIFSKHFSHYFAKTDCTHSATRRPSVHQKAFFRGDKRKHSILSSVTTTKDDIIIHLAVNIPGANNDSAVFRNSSLPNLISNGIVIADGGYPGCSNVLIPLKNVDHFSILQFRNEMLAKDRVGVEGAIGEMKRFNVFESKFRHQRSMHGFAAVTVAGIINCRKGVQKKSCRQKE